MFIIRLETRSSKLGTFGSRRETSTRVVVVHSDHIWNARSAWSRSAATSTGITSRAVRSPGNIATPRRIESGLSPERRSQGGSKGAARWLKRFVVSWSSD